MEIVDTVKTKEQIKLMALLLENTCEHLQPYDH